MFATKVFDVFLQRTVTRNFVKLVFTVYSTIYCYSIKFVWREDILDPYYFVPVKNKAHLLIWNFFQMSYPVSALVYSYSLLADWNDYLIRRDYISLIVHIYFIVLYLYATSFQYVFLLRQDNMIELLNETIKLANHFEEGMLPITTYVKSRIFRNRFMLGFGVGGTVSMMSVMRLIFVKFHRNHWYPFAYLPELFYSRNFYPTTFTASFAYQVWYELICWGGFGLQVYIMLLLFQTILDSLGQLNEKLDTTAMGQRGKDATAKNIVSSIVKINLLLNMYNETMGKYFLPHFNIIVGISTIGSLILLVKFVSNTLILAFSSLFLILTSLNLLVLTVLCGRVHSSGIQLCRKLEGKCRGRKLLRKQINALHIPAVKVGSFYTITRRTILTVTAIIYTAATNILISLSF